MQIPIVYQDYFQAHHFLHLTPIQEQVYPLLLKHQNVLALAPTGSGKTLAFGMPLLQQVQPGGGIQKLILEPSQELAIQTRDVLRTLNPDIQIYGLIGGANLKRQIESLKQKPEVVVATLGRLQDLIARKKIKLQHIDTLLVDEADELLTDQLDNIRSLINRLNSSLQLAFFSATKIPLFKDLHTWFASDFETVDLTNDSFFRSGLRHYFLKVDNQHKPDILQRLAHRKNKKNLVFCQSSKQLHRLAATLRYRKVYFTVLDTSDPKKRRADALADFRNQKTSLLLTTDVAARGMDITDLTTVINWENPNTVTEYIHRSGRAGRMGRHGEIITLGNQHDRRQLQALLQEAGIKLEKSTLLKAPIAKTKTDNSVSKTAKKRAGKKKRFSKNHRKPN